MWPFFFAPGGFLLGILLWLWLGLSGALGKGIQYLIALGLLVLFVVVLVEAIVGEPKCTKPVVRGNGYGGYEAYYEDCPQHCVGNGLVRRSALLDLAICKGR